MTDKDDKFRRVVADPKETGVSKDHEDQSASNDQVINAETGLPVEKGTEGVTLTTSETQKDEPNGDLSLSADDEVDASNISMTAQPSSESEEKDVGLKAEKEVDATDIAFKGDKKSEKDNADLAFAGKNESEVSDISFAGDKEKVEGDATLAAKNTAEYHAELCQKAETLNTELELLAEGARESAQKAQETMEEVERIAKAKNIPSRLASRLANVKAATSKIKDSTTSLAAKRDALKGGK